MHAFSKVHHLLHLGTQDPLRNMRSNILNHDITNKTHEDDKDVVLKEDMWL